MEKYIVEIDGKNICTDSDGSSKLALSVKADNGYAVFCTEIPLTPYTEPDLEQVRKEGYEKGYRRALADVREEQVCQTCVYFEQDENKEPCVRCPRNFIDQYTPKQERDVEIKAGDEVIYNGTTTCVVFCPENDKRYASIIDADGVQYSADHRELTKTGRHFPEIAEVLAKMKE